MAGIGVRLNKIFGRNTLTTNMIGFFYRTVVTVAPMFSIIINLDLMEYFLKFSTLGYAQRELFSCTILYTFIFSLLTASPFNAVLSRYISDVIYEERNQHTYYIVLGNSLIILTDRQINHRIKDKHQTDIAPKTSKHIGDTHASNKMLPQTKWNSDKTA